MKFAVALLLVAASVHANSSLHRYGWTPGQETIFHYESQSLNGIPGINNKQYAGMKLSCNVRVQAFSDYSLRLQMKDVKFLTYNGDVELNENGRIIGETGSEGHIPEEFRRHLEQPFLAHMKSGVVETLFVSKDEPVFVTNIKRSLLSQLQLDVSGTQRSQLESNHIQLPLPTEEAAGEQISYFTTNEESLHGKCLTKYTIHKLPEYRINELEEMWTVEERQLENKQFQSVSVESLSSSGSRQAKTHCEGKKYFQITKTRDFDQCSVRPFFQTMTTFEGNMDFSKVGSNRIATSLSSSTIYVCGEISNFNIRKIVSESVFNQQPSSEVTEQLKLTSKVHLELLKSKSISERIQLPSNLKEERSLVYHFHTEQSTPLSEEVVRETEMFFGVRPILSQPGLTEATKTLLPIKFHPEEIISQVYEQLKKMSNMVFKCTESCGSKGDVTGSLISITEQMRRLSLSELKQLENKIMQEVGNSSPEQKHLSKLFYDTLSMVGTNPSTMLVIEKVKSSSLPKCLLNKMIKVTINSVKFPTQELLRQLVEMAKCQTVSSNKELTATTLVHLSNLFYHAYINPSTMVFKYPVKIYGMFGNKNSPVLEQEYIPYLIEKLEQSGSNHLVRLSVVSALGKVGHMKSMKPLLKVAEGKYSKEPMIRSLAVYSLKRIAKRNQPELKPIVLSMINNPAEVPEVRIAAISILPWCQPTATDLQSIAIRSWMEPSKQVSSFFASTIKSLVHTQVPELKSLGEIVKPILSLLKHEEYGMQFSHNVHYTSFADYLRTVVSQKGSVVMTKNSPIPSRISFKNEQHIDQDSFKIRGLSFTAYTSGMDSLLDKYIHYFGKATETTSNVREQLHKIVEELEIQTRQMNAPKLFLQQSLFGIESSLYLDSETVLESLDHVSRRVQEGQSGEFNIVGAMGLQDNTILATTETGFLFTGKYQTPMVYAIKGSFKSSPVEGSIIPEITAKLIPVLNGKVEFTTGIMSPFTNELLGTGVHSSVHVSTPIEIKAKLTRGQLETTFKVPSEAESMGVEVEAIHGYVMPFTFKKNLLSVQPISKATSFKKIMSGASKTYETSFGQSMGLTSQLIAESDTAFTDFGSIVKKFKEMSPLAMISMIRLPMSTRYCSTMIKLQPSQWQTKEFQLKFKLTTKGYTSSPLSAGPINEQEIESVGFNSVKKTLNKLEGGKAILLEVTSSFNGQHKSGECSKFAIVFGNKWQNQELTVVSHAGLNMKSESSNVYGIRYESQTEYPVVKNRWNVEGILEENSGLKYEGKITYGIESSTMKEIKMKGSLLKSETQKMAVKESPEYKLCKEQESNGMKLTPTCRMVRIQASSMDMVKLDVEVPKSIYKNPLLILAGSMIESSNILRTSIKKVGGERETQLWKIEMSANRIATVGKVSVDTPFGYEIEVKNIPLNGYSILPVQTLNPSMTSLIAQLTKYQIPATCSVQPRMINTFDGESYGYKINDCSHLLLKDRSGKLPVAVMTRTLPQGEKSVKILSGVFELELIPQGSGVQSIILNGKTHSLEQNNEWKEKNSQGRVIAEFKRYQDNVYMVYIVDQMLTVWTDGHNVEVVAPQLLRSRSMGLCGDMNGEMSADIKTPTMCVMKHKLSAISYILNKSGSGNSVVPKCSGIPSELRQELNHATQRCVKENTIPTPLTSLYSRIGSLVQPTVSAHVVNKQGSHICFSKQMLKVCPGSQPRVGGQEHIGKPTGLSPMTVQFVCVSRPSSLGESLEKRALSGEPLMVELEKLPVAFSKTEYEPISCNMEIVNSRPTRSRY